MLEVYRNLHRSRAGAAVYSLRDPRTRRVVGHAGEVELVDVEFRVSEAGRQRVLRERRKNVHAVVRGTLQEAASVGVAAGEIRRATYNPYAAGTFTDRETGEPVLRASWARVGPDGITYVI